MYELVRLVLTPYLLLFYRARCIDSDKVPADGPAIIAPNHFSFLDHFFVAVYLRRKVHFMAKSQLFMRPIQFVYTHGGVFPVRRGQRDEEAFKTADAILEARRADRRCTSRAGARAAASSASSQARHRPAGARVRRADRARRPSHGTERVRNWKRLQFPKVTVQFGDPVRFEQVESPTREQSQAASEVVFEDVRELTRGSARKAAGAS